MHLIATDAPPSGLPRPFAAEDGYALPIALAILLMTGVLVFAAVGLATHNTDRANRDRDSIRAGQAADAGVDSALYRLNKALTASQAEGVLGIPVSTLAETTCVDVSAGQLATASATGSWCPSVGGNEQLDSGLEGGPQWDSASYEYTVSTGVNLGLDPNDSSANLIEREIVSVGTVGDVQKRILATARAKVGTAGNLLSVFEQVGYETCPPEPTDPADPASGC